MAGQRYERNGEFLNQSFSGPIEPPRLPKGSTPKQPKEDITNLCLYVSMSYKQSISLSPSLIPPVLCVCV